MKVQWKDITSCKKKLEFEIENEVVDKERALIIKDFAKKAKIPGFRPGRVPLSIIKGRFSNEIEAELKEKMVRKFFKQAMSERSLNPLHGPILEEYSQDEGKPLMFKVGFEIEPDITIKDYKGMTIKGKKVEVEEKDIEDVISLIRESMGRYESCEAQMAQDGDMVMVDLVGKFLDGKQEEIRNKNLSIIVGSEENLPEFNQQLFTMRKEEVKEFDVEYPKEYFSKSLAGRKVHYKMYLKEIKMKRLPDLDDAFAKNAYASYYANDQEDNIKKEKENNKRSGKEKEKVETMDELKEVIREKLLKKKTMEYKLALKNELLNRLIEANNFEIPEAMLENQMNYRVERMVRKMIIGGVNPAKAEVNWKEIREKQKGPATKDVKGMLILSAIARQEKIEASEEELNDEILREAKAAGVSFQTMKSRLSSRDLQELRNQIVREKSLDFLLSNANIS